MSGNDVRDLVFDFVLRRTRLRRERPRRLTAKRGLIALGVVSFVIILPVCVAHSRGGAAGPAADLDTSVSTNVPAGASMLPVWSEWPGAPADPTPAAPKAVEAQAPVESFTVYPNPTAPLAAPAGDDKQRLVEEIQRRLARMKVGLTDTDLELRSPGSQETQTAAPLPMPAPSAALDLNTDAPLQLFQPAGWTGPASPPPAARDIAPVVNLEPATTVTPKVSEDPPAVSPPDPNVNFNPAAQAAFQRHFEQAKALQQQRQYVRAADAFTLALAYRPSDPNAHLGKGLALFAAGQYPGCAAALARAVELDSQVALKKVDLVKIAGGPDEFIARFNDLARHAEAGPTPELHFLLAYIYYQVDQFDQARTALEAARKGSTSAIAVERLAAAVNR